MLFPLVFSLFLHFVGCYRALPIHHFIAQPAFPRHQNRYEANSRSRCQTQHKMSSHQGSEERDGQSDESDGVTVAVEYLNSSNDLLKKMAMTDEKLLKEMEKANFWTASNFVVDSCWCTGIVEEGLKIRAYCTLGNKKVERELLVLFPKSSTKVTSEIFLKRALIQMASGVGSVDKTGDIMKLPFGESAEMPLDCRFNDIPHPTWLRAYLYDQAANAIVKAVEDNTIPNKSRLQMKINFPEVNPKFDTYRIGTLLELVRSAALTLAEEKGLRVRVCVQQTMGEGIFTGIPLALSSMRVVMEKMDWGAVLTAEQKFKSTDNEVPREEALIRIGAIGPDQVADDDDVLLLIAPQNIIGACIVDMLEAMVKKAAGRPVIMINPNLEDKPSSDNRMQIRGRAERRAFQDSFTDIYALRLLYPSNGGYMFPIRGMIAKRAYHSPWVVYDKQPTQKGGIEKYDIAAAFDSYIPPTPQQITMLLT